MPEFARVVSFEADDAAIDALIAEIGQGEGPPPGVPATRITVLANRTAGQVVVALRFASEEDMKTGAEALEAMSPPDDGNIRRTSVDTFEVMLERTA